MFYSDRRDRSASYLIACKLSWTLSSRAWVQPLYSARGRESSGTGLVSDLISQDIRTVDTGSDWLIGNLGKVTRIIKGEDKCYQTKPKAVADNTCQDLEYSGYHEIPNLIIVLLYIAVKIKKNTNII